MMYEEYRNEYNVIGINSGNFNIEFIYSKHGQKYILEDIQYCKNSDGKKSKASWAIKSLNDTNMGLEPSDLVRSIFDFRLAEVFMMKVIK